MELAFWEILRIQRNLAILFFSQTKLFAEIEGLFAHMFCKECLKNLCNIGDEEYQPKIQFANIYALFPPLFWKDEVWKG